MKKKFFFLIFLFFFFCQKFLAQDSLFAYLNEKDRTSSVTGLKAYYFWEDDAGGYVKINSFKKVFKLNQSIILSGKPQSEDYSDSLFFSVIYTFSEENSTHLEHSKFTCMIDGKEEKIEIPLLRSQSKTPESIIYRKSEGRWTSEIMQNVLYFNVYSDSTRRFSHTSDTIIFQLDSLKYKALGHYLVKRFWDDYGKCVAEQVYTFDGQDITQNFAKEFNRKAQHIIVFANGYRGRKKNKDITDNLVTSKDRYHYWLRLDKAFIRRIKPDDYFYIDGNHSISSSNHRTMANFSLSYSRIKSLRKNENNRFDYHLLNTIPNDSGFYQRKANGVLAGQAFLAKYCTSNFCVEVKDTLDIVCHSMGYSYSLGFIEAVKDYVVFRNYYIIAPENAQAGGFDWTQFNEVWQYGTHTEGNDPEPVWKQDGVAPQVPVKGINDIPNGGRVYFPLDSKNLNFVNSHALNHYRWIFFKLNESDKGYVRK